MEVCETFARSLNQREGLGEHLNHVTALCAANMLLLQTALMR